jgi:nitrate reductase assembly molybdenum cofactor insertion protein NarJ
MADKLKELEDNVHLLAEKLREQHAIYSKLIELIKEIGNSEYNEYNYDKERLNNSIITLNNMNNRFHSSSV